MKILKETKKNINESSNYYSNIPLVDRLDFSNRRTNGMQGIYTVKNLVNALNSVGKDCFKVRTTKFGSNLSYADIKDEWMTLNKYGWSIQRVNDNSLQGFNEVYICKKTKKNESISEDLQIENPEEVGIETLFTNLINEEYNILNSYDSADVTIKDHGEDRFSEIFDYIRDDINIHIGMLQACLEDLNPDNSKEEGQQKAQEILDGEVDLSDQAPIEQLNLDESLFDDLSEDVNPRTGKKLKIEPSKKSESKKNNQNIVLKYDKNAKAVVVPKEMKDFWDEL